MHRETQWVFLKVRKTSKSKRNSITLSTRSRTRPAYTKSRVRTRAQTQQVWTDASKTSTKGNSIKIRCQSGATSCVRAPQRQRRFRSLPRKETKISFLRGPLLKRNKIILRSAVWLISYLAKKLVDLMSKSALVLSITKISNLALKSTNSCLTTKTSDFNRVQ